MAIVRHGGYLSAPGADARQFVRDNAILFGLTSRDVEGLVVVQEYVTRHNGARHVAFQQMDGSRVVHGSLLRLTLDSAGRVLTAGGALFPGPLPPASQDSAQNEPRPWPRAIAGSGWCARPERSW